MSRKRPSRKEIQKPTRTKKSETRARKQQVIARIWHKGHGRTKVIGLIILVLVVPFLWFLSYGLANKPLVDFTFGGASDIRPSYSLSAMTVAQPGTIDIVNVLIRNRGITDISVTVTVHAENALVASSYGGPYNDMASDAIVALANGEYRYVTFYLTLQTQVPSFTIWCDVTKIVDYSTVSSSIATTFGDINPIAPILLVYKQSSLDSSSYQLAK